MCERDIIGVSFLFNVFESSHEAWKTTVAAADTPGPIAHLDLAARALPRKQFGNDFFHTFTFCFEDKAVFVEGAMGVDEAEIEIKTDDVVS